MQDPYVYVKSMPLSHDAYCRYDINEIHNVEQYLKAVENCYKKMWNCDNEAISECNPKLWFRGLKSETYSLLPSIAREPYKVEFEDLYISDFKTAVIPHLSDDYKEESYLELLVSMRNYGIPSRLMSWTENALEALIYAIDINTNDEEAQNNPAVWCLNPFKLNENLNFDHLPNFDDKNTSAIVENENSAPCAVFGTVNNAKFNQKCAFTVFPNSKNITPFENIPNYENYLHKIIISKECRQSIIDQLKRYGLSKEQFISEVATIIEEIKNEGLKQ